MSQVQLQRALAERDRLNTYVAICAKGKNTLHLYSVLSYIFITWLVLTSDNVGPAGTLVWVSCIILLISSTM
uniref:Uncharacterized protein n=1 Tax=Arundo donax TaxID=35708 RepID=A0A0A9C689_ARUDO